MIHQPSLVVRTGCAGSLAEVLAAYRRSLTIDRRLFLDRYNVTDVARKVVGVSSVGLGSYVLLLQGAGSDDPLFLQLKEAPPSVLEAHLTRSSFPHNGQRVVAGQRIMQAASDPLLGWTQLGGRDFYVRQLRDMKATIPIERFDAHGLADYAALCASVLARAHACSGDGAQIAGYLGRGDQFDSAMARYAESYADQVEHDHQALLAAIARGDSAGHRRGRLTTVPVPQPGTGVRSVVAQLLRRLRPRESRDRLSSCGALDTFPRSRSGAPADLRSRFPCSAISWTIRSDLLPDQLTIDLFGDDQLARGWHGRTRHRPASPCAWHRAGSSAPCTARGPPAGAHRDWVPDRRHRPRAVRRR